jgi:hypothetical protein
MINPTPLHKLVANCSKLPCITLHRPWGYAVTNLGKPVENRTWECWVRAGQPIAIHSGQKWDKAAGAWIYRFDKRFDLSRPESDYPAQKIIAIARFVGNVEELKSPWFTGPIGWLLDSVTIIKPIHCPGQQRIWNIPDLLLPQVQANYAQAIALKL